MWNTPKPSLKTIRREMWFRSFIGTNVWHIMCPYWFLSAAITLADCEQFKDTIWLLNCWWTQSWTLLMQRSGQQSHCIQSEQEQTFGSWWWTDCLPGETVWWTVWWTAVGKIPVWIWTGLPRQMCVHLYKSHIWHFLTQLSVPFCLVVRDIIILMEGNNYSSCGWWEICDKDSV